MQTRTLPAHRSTAVQYGRDASHQHIGTTPNVGKEKTTTQNKTKQKCLASHKASPDRSTANTVARLGWAMCAAASGVLRFFVRSSKHMGANIVIYSIFLCLTATNSPPHGKPSRRFRRLRSLSRSRRPPGTPPTPTHPRNRAAPPRLGLPLPPPRRPPENTTQNDTATDTITPHIGNTIKNDQEEYLICI